MTTTTTPTVRPEEDLDDGRPWAGVLKLLAGSVLLASAVSTFAQSGAVVEEAPRRRLSLDSSYTPAYVQPLTDELRAREKLFSDTPKEEVKYWFEYAGPLQKYYYRYSKSRGKADSFEGRDDSGVTSARFVENPGAGADFEGFFDTSKMTDERELPYRSRLSHNCLTMGAPTRPKAGAGSFWYDWFGGSASADATMDRCRILFVMNTVGAGKGAVMLWETQPPASHLAGPKPWISEQETAATHLLRNLQEMNHLCATGQIAVRLQVLVCEPIPGTWTDWMDAQLVDCGGKISNNSNKKGANPYEQGIDVEDRPSPVQVVVVASAETADTCHDLKSGFMEQRMQDLVLAPPYKATSDKEKAKANFDPSKKTTHPDLISSDDHDLYVAFKWSSLVTIRTVSAFLQSSADLVAAAGSVHNTKSEAAKSSSHAGSSFLIPSFVRMSYVSEENNKVAKWRMHGDFFHPAAWEISKDSYEMTWVPDSLSSNDVQGACHTHNTKSRQKGEDTRRLKEEEHDEECGQWWVFMKEEQMPTTPEIFANEHTPTLVRGGSNFIWMLTELQRKQLVTKAVCDMNKDKGADTNCGDEPHAVIPLGDLESHLVNFMPNTSLGKKHESNRRPGYSLGDKLEKEREKVRERKQLKGQDDIEKALFDYTIYPAALFHKDATIMAARTRDAVLGKDDKTTGSGPQVVMSDYYDVTITKPRAPLPSWCQHLSRRGLCSLYADYLRESSDQRCLEACGMKKNWKSISSD